MQLKAHNLDDLNRIANSLIQYLEVNKNTKCIAFYGEMGAGKTTLIKQICENLNVLDIVNSPTFAIINVYNTKKGTSIYHFDFYRIKTIEEIYDLGYEEYFSGNNLCLIEWPEKIKNLLPENCLAVYITEEPNGTRIIKY